MSIEEKRDRFCTECGARVRFGANYCGDCGSSLLDDESAPVTLASSKRVRDEPRVEPRGPRVGTALLYVFLGFLALAGLASLVRDDGTAPSLRAGGGAHPAQEVWDVVRGSGPEGWTIGEMLAAVSSMYKTANGLTMAVPPAEVEHLRGDTYRVRQRLVSQEGEHVYEWSVDMSTRAVRPQNDMARAITK